MANPQLSNIEVQKFESTVHHEYQDIDAGIKNTVRFKDAKGAKSVKFPVYGKRKMQKRTSFHTPLPTGDTSKSQVTLTLAEFTVSEWSDIFLDAKVNYDDRTELAMVMKNALLRQEEQIIIDALDGAAITNLVADDISGAADDLSVAAFRESSRLLGTNGVPRKNRHLLGHTNGLHHLTENTQVISSDFSNKKVLVDGFLSSFYGFGLCEIGDRDEGGLPVPSANHRTSFAYHKQAVAFGAGLKPRITVGWVDLHGAFLVSAFLQAASVVIDVKGTVKITTDES